MTVVSPFCEAKSYDGADLASLHGLRMAAAFSSPADEYYAARERTALFDRSDRALLAVSGSDARNWLHSLVTNSITTLAIDHGCYAFAANAKGRILFDLNVLCMADGLWLDLDRRAVPEAAAHFDRQLLTEDVRLTDLTGQFARLACSGPQAPVLAARLGVENYAALPALAGVWLEENAVRLLRHDFADEPGFELIVPRGQAVQWWERLVELGARPAGRWTLDTLRSEAGLPWLWRDLADGVLPAETGQMERATSTRKRGYLGQKAIEGSRKPDAARGRLVRLEMGEGRELELPAMLWRDGVEVGRITSLVQHPARPRWVGLGFLRRSVTGFAEITTGDPPRAVVICSA